MPAAVAAAVVSSFAAEAIGGYLAADLLVGGVVGGIAETLGIGLVSQAIGGIAGFATSSMLKSSMGLGAMETTLISAMPTASFTSEAAERSHVVRSTIQPRSIIYGRAKMSGPLVFAASSSDHNTLHLVVPLAGHECEGIDEIWFGDDLLPALDGNGNVTSGQYSGYATIKIHLGAADQVADADLVAANVGWTSAHRLRGVCYLYLKLTWNKDAYPRGIPNIAAVVRGKKLYDPRTSTTAYSDNWALAVRDYLASGYGLAATSAEIDDATFIAAANLADETVYYAGGGSEKRYTANGVASLSASPMTNMEQLLSAGAGALVWQGGLYRLIGGAYVSPSTTLSEDSLRGPLAVRARTPRRDLANGVRGTYLDPSKNWTAGDFPPVKNATYAAQDGAEIIKDIALPYTTTSQSAQRIAKIALEKGRQGITVDMPCKPMAFKIAVGDVVQLTIAHLGWANKEFRVMAWRLAENGAVDLALQEESSAAYAWSAEETKYDAAPDTNLPNPFTVLAPGVPEVTESLFQTTGSAGVKARATMTWSAVPDAFVVDYLPEWRVAGGSWVALPSTTGLSADIADIAPGNYEFRLRARNAMGVKSAYSGTRAREILGLAAPPTSPTNFSVIAQGGIYYATWDLSPDLDVRIGGRAVIRHSTLTGGATWMDGVIVGEFNGDAVSGLVPLMAGAYLLKFQDSSGNWCDTAASFVPSEALLTGWAIVGTSTQHPAFAGAKTNTAAGGGELYLAGTALVDGMTDSIDSWIGMDWIGGVSASGSYDFDATMDMTTVASRRFDSTVTAAAFDIGGLIDTRTAMVDDWSDIEGGVVNDVDATLYIRTTPDNPSASPTWSSWAPFFVGDFNCRAAQFRLDLVTGNPSHNIKISALQVRAKIPA